MSITKSNLNNLAALQVKDHAYFKLGCACMVSSNFFPPRSQYACVNICMGVYRQLITSSIIWCDIEPT